MDLQPQTPGSVLLLHGELCATQVSARSVAATGEQQAPGAPRSTSVATGFRPSQVKARIRGHAAGSQADVAARSLGPSETTPCRIARAPGSPVKAREAQSHDVRDRYLHSRVKCVEIGPFRL
jgi:hypothetical protein